MDPRNSAERHFIRHRERLFQQMPQELREAMLGHSMDAKIKMPNAVVKYTFEEACAELWTYEQFIDRLAVRLVTQNTELLERLITARMTASAPPPIILSNGILVRG